MHADEYDPHIWFDVTLWMQTVEQVRDTLMAEPRGFVEAVDIRDAATLQPVTGNFIAWRERWLRQHGGRP